MITLADLKKGQKAIIKDFQASLPNIKLLELGCLPGNTVELVQKAPFKDPIYINLNGSHIAIRNSTAKMIEITLV